MSSSPFTLGRNSVVYLDPGLNIDGLPAIHAAQNGPISLGTGPVTRCGRVTSYMQPLAYSVARAQGQGCHECLADVRLV